MKETHEPLSYTEALTIVLDLAQQNALSNLGWSESEGDLRAEADRQDEAIALIDRWRAHLAARGQGAP
jgi:hypothetical protein